MAHCLLRPLGLGNIVFQRLPLISRKGFLDVSVALAFILYNFDSDLWSSSLHIGNDSCLWLRTLVCFHCRRRLLLQMTQFLLVPVLMSLRHCIFLNHINSLPISRWHIILLQPIVLCSWHVRLLWSNIWVVEGHTHPLQNLKDLLAEGINFFIIYDYSGRMASCSFPRLSGQKSALFRVTLAVLFAWVC